MKKITVFLLIAALALAGFAYYQHLNYETPILMYHSLDEKMIDITPVVTADVFYKQMAFIKKGGYNVIAVDDYCQVLKDKRKPPPRAVVITFDDGYRDNLRAVKILKEFRYPAAIFLIVNNIGKKDYLSRDDVLGMLKNTKVRIGSHTLTHAYLPSLKTSRLKEEISYSKIKLENLFPYEVRTISYPVGGFDERVEEAAAEANYLCGFTTNRGFSSQGSRYALRRIKITNRDLGIRLWAKLSGFYNSFRKLKRPY